MAHDIVENLKAGDTILQCHSEFYNLKLCNYKCKSYSFIGNHSGNYLDMIIEIKDGVVQDMYECSEFKMQVKYLKKNERIVLKMGFNDRQVKAVLYVVGKGSLRNEYQKLTDTSKTIVTRDLQDLETNGILTNKGTKGSSSKYELESRVGS